MAGASAAFFCLLLSLLSLEVMAQRGGRGGNWRGRGRTLPCASQLEKLSACTKTELVAGLKNVPEKCAEYCEEMAIEEQECHDLCKDKITKQCRDCIGNLRTNACADQCQGHTRAELAACRSCKAEIAHTRSCVACIECDKCVDERQAWAQCNSAQRHKMPNPCVAWKNAHPDEEDQPEP
eukprot:TRINITY_DN67100_c8_g2_i1.p1 TRINITY_DN67100_c8_g2~~TRINITY_DN67100_c8_g2_i1.p1  ORF type:complete len:180 (-),score=19.06 TRINITY_DN67100_c8_g2_i1:482-1021(-)